MRPLPARRLILPALTTALMLAGCGGSDDEATVRVLGAIDRPATLNVQALASQPVVAQTVSFQSGSGAQTHSYTGADLWALLSGMGIQTNATPRNDVLNRYVLATGTDGYRSVFALGELHPEFGNKGALLAYAETRNGATAPIAAEDGPLRVTAPGDVKGGRYVSQLMQLDVRSSGSTAAATGGGVAPSFTVSGAVGRPMTFDYAALQALPAGTLAVGANTYGGVSLWTLLNTVTGIVPDSDAKNPSIRMFAVATGSDGYKAMVSLGEIDPGFGNRPALVATSLNGVPLTANGMARLVVGGDIRAGRWVSNLVAIEVLSASPPP